MSAPRGRTAHAVFRRAGDSAFHGSVGAGNRALVRALGELGYATHVHAPRAVPGALELLPVHQAAALAELARRSPADLALYDDAGLAVCAPGRRWAARNVVYYHGLVYNPGIWLANDAIDLHIANSPYLARVVESFLAFPDWHKRRCLAARAFEAVAHATLPLPCLEEPGGSSSMGGAAVPDDVRALLDGPMLVGHCLQPLKQDFIATVSILFALDDLARSRGLPGACLLVPASDLTPDAVAALDEILVDSGRTTRELYVGTPHLSQAALFEVMRAADFGLCFNTMPESFGFYALESVHNGCPVFTNGMGNTRHVLPPDHGLHVFDGMTPGAEEPPDYTHVAEAIDAALRDRAASAAACRRGVEHLRRHHDRAAAREQLGAALSRLDGERDAIDFDSLRIDLGPIVHRHVPGATSLHTDLGVLSLDPDEARALTDLLGRSCGDVTAADVAAIGGLFARGVLCLTRPPG